VAGPNAVDPAQEDLLLFIRTPTRGQVRLVSLLAALLLVAFLLSLPFGSRSLPKIPSFIPVVDTALLLGDVLTATLLFGQAAVLRSRALLTLATGYLFTGLIIIPHALTFPGAFSPTGLLGAGVSSTIWIYFVWHSGLPVAVIVYAVMKRCGDSTPIPPAAVRPLILACVAGAAVVVALFALLATAREAFLPVLMTDTVTWLSGPVFYVAVFVLALLVIAMATVARKPVSLLDVWLLLALWAWLLELLLVLNTSTRFSAGWYTGRIAGLLSGVFVLMMLLSETSRMYSQLAVATIRHRRERASRLLTMNAVAASIAHEIKQPLTAVVMNARIGLERLTTQARDPAHLTEILTAISDDGAHAIDAVQSIRSMFHAQRGERTSLNLNDLIQEIPTLVAGELSAHRITVDLQLSDRVPAMLGDRVQMQHMLLNLFTNAIEAMADVTDRPRILSVHSGLIRDAEIVVRVEDSGVGFEQADAERIFDTFFTTKAAGTGMGLPLCRAIVEGHGGALRASARRPAGAIFELTLPLR
jgi:signal transduction histidine kinase